MTEHSEVSPETTTYFPKGSLNHWRAMHRLKSMAAASRVLSPIGETQRFGNPSTLDVQSNDKDDDVGDLMVY
jgi:hypothetical protein